jgi:hypothetical protein
MGFIPTGIDYGTNPVAGSGPTNTGQVPGTPGLIPGAYGNDLANTFGTIPGFGKIDGYSVSGKESLIPKGGAAYANNMLQLSDAQKSNQWFQNNSQGIGANMSQGLGTGAAYSGLSDYEKNLAASKAFYNDPANASALDNMSNIGTGATELGQVTSMVTTPGAEDEAGTDWKNMLFGGKDEVSPLAVLGDIGMGAYGLKQSGDMIKEAKRMNAHTRKFDLANYGNKLEAYNFDVTDQENARAKSQGRGRTDADVESAAAKRRLTDRIS